MHQTIQISKINDYVFCPHSLFFHSVYDDFDKKTYQQIPQIKGSLNHKVIDRQEYSSKKRYLQGLYVFSEKYNLSGKIDIYDVSSKSLIERKSRIKKIYDGYVFQLLAQKICLEEMGYQVDQLILHSLEDNKRYCINQISKVTKLDFFNVIQGIWKYLDNPGAVTINKNKCSKCIYRSLCFYA